MAVATPDDGDTVRVAARVRPLLPREKVANNCNCITVDKGTQQIVVGTRRTFAFDVGFDTDATQSEVYDACAASLLSGCLQGYNATILAYGQTGSGKTHTMGTGQANAPEDMDDAENIEGITPKVIRNSFAHIEGHRDELEFKVSCCYLEIYNEEIRDLLQPDGQKHAIAVRETAGGVIQLAGIHAEACSSVAEMLRCLADGSMQRTTAATLMNEQSSRSHSIFTIIFEQRRRGNTGQRQAWSDEQESGSEHSGQLSYRTAKFHLVDLAGSERAKRTGAVGSRFKESVSINGGLLALGNVISALGDPAKRGSHVPYRESKLTRLLQDSLGGNSRTWMLACVSCADSDFEETLNTLKYAHRARNIKNKPVVNHDPRVAQLAAMQDEIEALRSELRRVSMSPAASACPLPKNANGDAGNNEILAELNEKLEGAEQRHVEVVERLINVEAGAEALRHALTELYKTICENMSLLGQAWLASTEARDVARATVCKSLQSAKNVLTELSWTFEVSADLPPVPALDDAEADSSPEDTATIMDECRHIPESVDAALESPDAAGLGETSRLESLAEMRRDATPLLRKYLDEIKRLESELVLYKRRTRQLQEELMQARDDLQKDEEIFDEKMRELRSFEKENEILHRKLQETQQAPTGRTTVSCSTPPCVASVTSEPLSLAARLEDCDEVVTDEPEVCCPTTPSVPSPNVASPNTASIDEHVDEAVQSELDESLGNQRWLEQELKQLSQHVTMKEELITELIRSEREWGATKAQYQKVIEQLQAELEHMQRELALVQSQQQESGHKEDRSALERRIAEQTDCIRRKQQEFCRLRELRQQDSKKIRDLEAEINQMRSKSCDLDRKLQAERKRTARLEDLKSQQINDLQLRLQKEGQKVRTLEAENMRHRETLSKEQRSRGGTPLRPSRNLSKDNSVAQRGTSASSVRTIDKIAQGSDVCENSVGSAASSRAYRLEQQIDDHIRRHEASQSLEEDVRKRDGLLKKKDQYLSYRRKIVAKDSIEQEELREGLVQLEARMAELDTTIANIRATGVSDTAREQSQRDALAAEHAHLSHSGQCKHEEGLTVLHDVDEKLESLQDEIDFREARIEKAHQILRSAGSAAGPPPVPGKPLANLTLGGPLDAELAGLPAEDAKELLSRYCEKIVRYRQREKHTAKRLTALEAQLAERNRQAAELESVLRKQDANSTKAIAKVTKEYEGRIRILLRQLSAAQQNEQEQQPVGDLQQPHAQPKSPAIASPAASDEKRNSTAPESGEIKQLQRDNQYYKAVNRELKKRLRDLLERAEGSGLAGAGEANRKSHDDLAAQVRRLEKEKEEALRLLEREREAQSEEKPRATTPVQNSKQSYKRFHDVTASPGGRPQPGAPGPIPSDTVQPPVNS